MTLTADASTSAPSTATIGLALFAPNNESVQLVAEWNGWEPHAMTRGDDGWWRVDATLADGKHRYRFRVKSRSYFAEGQTLDVTDPYALQVAGDAEENAIVRVEGGRQVWTTYDWRHDAVPLPTNDKLVIYELHLGDFTGTKSKPGTFVGAIDKLDYLRDLGFNAIELLPVKEFPGRGWGYSLKSLFGVENSYGTPDELCRFIDECHARGIRVVLDGVYNHMHPECYLGKIDHSYWFYRTNPDGPEMDWGPKFNFEFFDEQRQVYPARKYVHDSIRFWVEKFHIDGIRFDATAAIKHADVMREMTDIAYGMVGGLKPFITIAEHVPEEARITGRERGAPMDAAWHEYLGHVLRSVLTFTPMSGQDPHDVDKLLERLDPARNGYELATRVVNFVATHDYKRPMQTLAEDGGLFGEAAFRRMKLGHGLLLTAPGLPMVWMGSEFGMPSPKTYDEPWPLDWPLIDQPLNRDLLEFHRTLIALRRDVPALHSDQFETLVCDYERKVIAFKRWTNDGSVAIVVANLEEQPHDDVYVPVAGLEDKTFRDALPRTDAPPAVQDGAARLALGPSEIRVLIVE